MIRKLLSVIMIAICMAASLEHSIAQQPKKQEEVSSNPNAVRDTARRSINSAVTANIANGTITIRYHSPGVRGRPIWGKLVPYDKIWVTGAHDATSIESTNDLVINGKEIPAGRYALFTIPGRETWTVIINRNWKQHQADKYDQKEDITRFKVKPQKSNNHTERLQYFIENLKRNKATVRMAWETLQIKFDVQIKNKTGSPL